MKSNKLVESRSDFTLTQQRAILLAMVQIKPDSQELGEYKIHIADVLGLPKEKKLKGAQYRQVRESLEQLTKTSIDILDSDEQWDSRNFISRVRKVEGNDFIYIKFSAEVKEFLIGLTEKFTKYSLRNVSQLKKVYSIRLYELCKQYESLGERKIEYMRFRDMLYIKEKKSLSNPSRIRERVIIPAIAEINESELTDIQLSFEEITKGRSVTHYHFKIKRKNASNTVSLNQGNGEDHGTSKPHSPSPSGFPDPKFYEKLLKKYDQGILDFSIEKIRNLDHVVRKEGYLLKALKDGFYQEEFDKLEEGKRKMKEVKLKKNRKQQEDEKRDLIRMEYDGFRKSLLKRFIEEADESDLALFCFEIEDSESSLERKYFSEFESGKPSDLAISYYSQWLVQKYGNEKDQAMLDITNYAKIHHQFDF
ncbi:RepB family plasmid replication initiator protein [Xanthovirga aplysinae]|uniref:RepB family plasmid replication initiator protein n=1 Tax=Xanthovirga aplysinae TaxID=2529853 RepID=UPI001656A405